jgi:hypothetical protein
MIIQEQVKTLKSRIRNKWGTVNNFYNQFEKEFMARNIKIAHLTAIVGGRKHKVCLEDLDYILTKVKEQPDNYCTFTVEMKHILKKKITAFYGSQLACCDKNDIALHELQASFRKRRFDDCSRKVWSAVGLPPVCATEEVKEQK